VNGRTRRSGLLIAVLSCVLVLGATMAVAERHSPGPISSVHGGLPALAGGQACSSCHGGWFGNMRSACAECHAEIEAQLTHEHGLHGRLPIEQVAECSACHGEHHGEDFRLVNRLAFAQAGVADPAKFDHRLVGFVLEGAHAALACTGCHVHADSERLEPGQKRFLGLSRDCASCHHDPHAGRMQLDCATCHTQSTFEQRFVARHERWLAIDGAHAAADCRACHASGTAHALESLREGSHERARTCGDCHDSPHSDHFLAGNTAAAARPGSTCAGCHSIAGHSGFDDPRATVTPAEHRHGGFALEEPHAGLACSACHTPTATFRERHPGRRADDCRACHEDPHGGQFDGTAAGQGGCIGCHEHDRFAPHHFDRDDHARTRLPLDGRHAEQDCNACHVSAQPGEPRQFAGTAHRCEQCHDDAHGGAFGHRQTVLAAAPRGACAVCHGTASWSGVAHERFDHADWTGFAVDGAHGQIECTDCHAPTPAPDHFGRRFGRIPRSGGDATAGHASGGANCTRCHDDPHAGVFDRDAVPATVDGRLGCERCHDTASFRALPYGFDHGAFARFPLLGKHAELACGACHEPIQVTETASGRTPARTAGRVRGSACADCHADPHRGQFERLGRTDCTRCHKSTTSFATLSFRHNLDSRFQLGEQHANVPCARCHELEKAAGAAFARYKPLPVTCVECHGREEGGSPFRRRNR
jgi:hypothetical protein